MKNNLHQSKKTLFRYIELATEVVGFLQIVASPLLTGLVIGSVIYLSDMSIARLIIGSVVATLGLIIGIKLAYKHWKGKGTIRFMSRVIATPELDNNETEND